MMLKMVNHSDPELEAWEIIHNKPQLPDMFAAHIVTVSIRSPSPSMMLEDGPD